MSSGRKALRQNTRERLISTDPNRVQSFVAGYANEALRQQMLQPKDDSLSIGTTFLTPGPLSAAFDVLAPAAPDYGGVLGGLTVVVPAAATHLLITAGMLLVVDPEGAVGSTDSTPLNPDDGPGPSRLVASAGVTVAGALTWAPNPGPGARVDVVECQRANVVVETDNRDIFNPATGLFTPAAVTKVTAGDLVFRVRQGVAGGGLPAPALGWVPLAIISAPAGAVDLDACTVWDVRPLLSDTSAPYAQVRSIYPTIKRFGVIAENKTAPAELRLSGEVQGDYLGQRIGGIISDPSVTNYVDLNDVTYYQAAGFVAVPSSIYFVYALWPGGYVRWVQYHATPIAGFGGRAPGSFRGIIAVSQVPNLNGQPLAPVATPSGWGLGVSTAFGQMIAAGSVSAGAALDGFVGDDYMIQLEASQLSTAPASLVDPDVGFVLVPGVHFPAGAKRVRLLLTAIFTGFGAAGDRAQMFETLDIVTAVGANQLASVYYGTTTITRPTAVPTISYLHTIDLPVVADGITVPPAIGIKWSLTRVDVGDGTGVLSAALAIVTGWSE